ncbi:MULTISPECIES: MFS transporter [unclassified Lysobacter]|uniref:MFS transporter n=1 Tax=unclassified Lysobacter TaxID=2635362 RepID=UPI001BE8F49D|nr:MULTISPECIES: MFS transporter [unclassified Lysobacter]MBT2750125.1 MFS transporter [Lysobacter sp. ISL-50]MBT2775303.1 MFS transporter [Lysobacter sp. ISL-54]MBT2782677.1 MFS transporter [Lysobacter sp. ISL-52]
MASTAATEPTVQAPAAAPPPADVAPPGPPLAPTPMSRWRIAGFVSISLLLGLTQSLGMNLVASNLQQVQGALGATSAEATWLLTAYFATNIPASLLLTKFRLHYGLRLFADLGIGLFVVAAVVHLLANDLDSAIAARAALGIAAAPLSSLTILYMAEVFTGPKKIVGLMFGFAALQTGAPISRIVAETLLLNAQWHGIVMFELGLALACLAAINLLRVTPVPRQNMFDRWDIASFPLYASAIALVCVVLTQGRLRWWLDTPWLGHCLVAAVLCAGAFVMIEMNRSRPMVNIRWLLHGGYMVRLGLAIVLSRMVLSEQSVGAVGLLNVLGLLNDQMHTLFWLVLIGTVAGFVVTLPFLPRQRFDMLGLIAVAIVGVCAYIDSHATNLTRPANFYITQTLIAMAASMFLASSILLALVRVVADGVRNLVTFIVLFSTTNALGGLLGSAVLGTYLAQRQTAHYQHLMQQLTLGDPQVVLRTQQLGGAVARVVGDPAARGNQALTSLSQQVTRESWVLAYNDVFLSVAWLAVVVLVWVLLLKWHLWRRGHTVVSFAAQVPGPFGPPAAAAPDPPRDAPVTAAPLQSSPAPSAPALPAAPVS